ncbi:WD repeat-containing protein 34-like [Tropilaelaps mercedesae]|uniref:WD repeat-containing protein 34-like n=1 Tax=Tropilaelaps mercedesae TaxID=418985 RepID=A0A1V9XPR5_9ACAR|nr:WD repeat-containing protein 34-like [Tropilaelaps mercedesae]
MAPVISRRFQQGLKDSERASEYNPLQVQSRHLLPNCNHLILGTEGGYVMLGSLAASHSVFENRANKCVTMTFKKHQGHVTSSSFNPHSRNVFLTSSIDQNACVYSQLQPSPVISLVHSDQLVKALWSCANQLHVATATYSGQVALYDIRKAYMPLAEVNLARRITDLAFIGIDQLAVSTDKGDVHLLQLSDGFFGGADSAQVGHVVNSLQDGIGFE